MNGYFFIAIIFLFRYIYKEFFCFIQVKYESQKRKKEKCKFNKICSNSLVYIWPRIRGPPKDPIRKDLGFFIDRISE
jgi:hypothetical protein